MTPQERLQTMADRLFRRWLTEPLGSPVMGYRVDADANSIHDGGGYNEYGRKLPPEMTEDKVGWRVIADFGRDE